MRQNAAALHKPEAGRGTKEGAGSDDTVQDQTTHLLNVFHFAML